MPTYREFHQEFDRINQELQQVPIWRGWQLRTEFLHLSETLSDVCHKVKESPICAQIITIYHFTGLLTGLCSELPHTKHYQFIDTKHSQFIGAF